MNGSGGSNPSPSARLRPECGSHIMLIKQHGRLFDLEIPKSFKVVYAWGKGLALFANRNFKKGEKIIYMKGKLVSAANSTPEAVQMSEKMFIDGKYLVPEDFINHSCSPNTKLDAERRWFIAIQDISKNEEIAFNYLTTEWDMKEWGLDFKCSCGSRNCLGHIQGFKYLSRTEQRRLKPFLSPYLLGKLEELSS